MHSRTPATLASALDRASSGTAPQLRMGRRKCADRDAQKASSSNRPTVTVGPKRSPWDQAANKLEQGLQRVNGSGPDARCHRQPLKASNRHLQPIHRGSGFRSVDIPTGSRSSRSVPSRSRHVRADSNSAGRGGHQSVNRSDGRQQRRRREDDHGNQPTSNERRAWTERIGCSARGDIANRYQRGGAQVIKA